KRGPMVRQVQGQGTLVPVDVRWVGTPIAGSSVEKINVLPGAEVEADTVLVVLSNPDVVRQANEADRQVDQAKADSANLAATLENQRLAQESALATLKSDLGDATRRAAADDELAKKGFLSSLEMEQSRARERELRGRIEFEQRRLQAMGRGISAQVEAQKGQDERRDSLAH